MTKIIEINKLFFAFNHDNIIFKELDLSIFQGEIICILGESGAGKSTLLKLLNNGFPDKTIPETNILTFVNNGILLVPQDYNSMLLPWMTVKENILFGLKGEKISHILELLEIGKYENEYPKNLSGGQKQRVILARALLRKPTLLLLDEPFSSVDINSRQRIIKKLLAYFSKYNISALWITHSIDEAVQITNKIYMIKEMVLKKIIGNTKKALLENIMNEFLEEKINI